MDKNWFEQGEQDLTKPRRAADKQTWKVNHNAVHWVDICSAQRMDSKNPSEQGRMRSFSIALFRQSAVKEWCPGNQNKPHTPRLQSGHILLRRLPSNLMGKEIDAHCAGKKQ